MDEQGRLSPQESWLLGALAQLNEEGREKVADYTETLLLTGHYRPGVVRLSWVARRQRIRRGTMSAP